jgi:hypothetical protein
MKLFKVKDAEMMSADAVKAGNGILFDMSIQNCGITKACQMSIFHLSEICKKNMTGLQLEISP